MTDVVRPPSKPVFRPALGELMIAVGVIGFAVLVYLQTQAIPKSPLYSRVGPTVAPTLAWMGLAILGLALLRSSLRGGWQAAEEKETTLDWHALAWAAGGLALNVVLIGPLGFTIASVLMFVCIARAFGSRQILRDAGIALTLALIAYFGFAGLLGINIGAGLVENGILNALKLIGVR
jgi:putative tricarboxylic transport membrane protein